MKKNLFLLICGVALSASLCVGCGNKSKQDNSTTEEPMLEMTTNNFDETEKYQEYSESETEFFSESFSEAESHEAETSESLLRDVEDKVNEAVSKVTE